MAEAQAQTLDELKNENTDELENQEEIQNEEEQEEAADTDNENTDEEQSDEEKGGDEEQVSDENQEWLEGDDDTNPGPEKKFTDGDIGKFKVKLTAKIEKKSQKEIDALNAEIEALRNNQNKVATDLKTPVLDDYAGEDNQNEAFMVALSDYNQKVSDARTQASTQALQVKQQNNANLVKIQTGVTEHYERVVTLAEKSGISADQYKGAELQVRQLVDSLYPDAGDALVDAFISKVGIGSEKVFYNLGVNTKKRMAFKAALENDPSGIEASMFLGELKSQLNNPVKRKTATPAPAAEMKGDKNEKAATKSLRKEYEKASTSGDMQAQFDIRRKAKAAGITKNEINKW